MTQTSTIKATDSLSTHCFFIGTIAELIKILPILMQLQAGGIAYDLVATNQNNLDSSHLWRQALRGAARAPLQLGRSPKRKSIASLALWFFATMSLGFLRLRRWLPREARFAYLIVHGDTLSTLMGAILGRLLGMRVAHVEGGLRSYNYLRPFPEEISRVLVSRLACLAFCPNEWAVANLSGLKSLKTINTKNNTLLESTALALADGSVAPPAALAGLPADYFVFVIHRQENIYNRNFLAAVVNKVLAKAAQLDCLFVLHEPTRVALENIGMLASITNTPRVHVVSRLPYFEFVKALAGCAFILTDGGSNQEEAYFLGKPCLVLRRETERIEGLGQNARLLTELADIDSFFATWSNLKQPAVEANDQPSRIIVGALQAALDWPRTLPLATGGSA